MKKRMKMLLAAAPLLLLCLSSTPQKRTLCEGFLPENDLRIPVDRSLAHGIFSLPLGITEESFNKVLDRAQEVYGPIIAARGGRLVINRFWTDPVVNASAEQRGDEWILNMYGGLARHEAVTADVFALVVCHELGHHLGGFPKKKFGRLTNEGGADYFATLKCLRKVFPEDVAPQDADTFAAEACSSAYPAGPQRNICLRSAATADSAAKLDYALRHRGPVPAFNTPDPSIVLATDDAHPQPQCRLDTRFQGTLCAKPVSEELSATSPEPGACTTSQGFIQGLRPLCWYHPAEGEAIAAAGAAVRPASLPSEKSLDERLQALRGALLSGGGR